MNILIITSSSPTLSLHPILTPTAHHQSLHIPQPLTIPTSSLQTHFLLQLEAYAVFDRQSPYLILKPPLLIKRDRNILSKPFTAEKVTHSYCQLEQTFKQSAFVLPTTTYFA